MDSRFAGILLTRKAGILAGAIILALGAGYAITARRNLGRNRPNVLFITVDTLPKRPSGLLRV